MFVSQLTIFAFKAYYRKFVPYFTCGCLPVSDTENVKFTKMCLVIDQSHLETATLIPEQNFSEQDLLSALLILYLLLHEHGIFQQVLNVTEMGGTASHTPHSTEKQQQQTE